MDSASHENSSAPKHAPEPWDAAEETGKVVKAWTVYAPDPSEYADPDGLMVVADHLTEGNAKRMSACVNACRGLSTESLHGLSVKANDEVAAAHEAALAETLGALRALVSEIDLEDGIDDSDWPALQRARALLACVAEAAGKR